jgi:phosphoglycolate phosphatase-like HAD superfamily hydrolase
MAWGPLERTPEQCAILDRLLAIRGPGVAFLDLDGCLIDNRSRQVTILRRYGSRHDRPELYRVSVEHFTDWTLPHTLRNAGLEGFEPWFDDLHAFWRRCFFSEEDLVLDHAMPGAVQFVRQLVENGLSIVYLTARDHPVRDGTLRSLELLGFPVERTILQTLDDLSREFHTYKRDAALTYAHLGEALVFLDNEPSIVNAYRETFPDAMTVFVDTDRSPKPVEPHPDLPVIRGFCR